MGDEIINVDWRVLHRRCNRRPSHPALFERLLPAARWASSFDRAWYPAPACRWRGVVRHDARQELATVLTSFRVRGAVYHLRALRFGGSIIPSCALSLSAAVLALVMLGAG